MKTVLFDMDGVLIDVSRSYLVAIQQAVAHFSQSEVSNEEIQSFRNRGGLNNDWDLSQAILKQQGFEIARAEIISVFQRFYLGSEFNGLINQETAFARSGTLKALSREYAIGVVTGRPRTEAVFTLKRLGLLSFFPNCVTADDIPAGKGKPDPAGLLLAMENAGTDRGYYIGDTVDDIKAALAVGLQPVGIVHDDKERSRQTEILTQAGATWVLKDVNRIMEVLT